MNMIDELMDLRQDIRHAELFATYVIAATKERIEGCVKYTHSLHDLVFVQDCSPGCYRRLPRYVPQFVIAASAFLFNHPITFQSKPLRLL
jgi:hypothetical protein